MEKAILLKEIESSVVNPDKKRLESLITSATDNQTNVSEIRQSILDGLDKVRKKLLSNQSSLPELLISLDTTDYGLDMLCKNTSYSPQLKDPVSLVLGVVEGDPHDLGKNIISLIYKSFGYQVYDLGSQVPKDLFIKTVLEKNARILGLSAMMSTTMTIMPEIIKELKIVSPDTLVIVGGAPLDEKLAESYGADGYAESAVNVLEQTRIMLDSKGS